MRHFDNKIVIFQSIICVGNIREHIREHYDKNYHKMHLYEVRNPVPRLEQAHNMVLQFSTLSLHDGMWINERKV
jgi:hypothetical protein